MSKKNTDIISMEKFFDMDSVHTIRCTYGLPCSSCEYSDLCTKCGINKDNFFDKFRDKYNKLK